MWLGPAPLGRQATNRRTSSGSFQEVRVQASHGVPTPGVLQREDEPPECLTFYLFLFVFRTCGFKGQPGLLPGEPEGCRKQTLLLQVVCDISLCIPGHRQ